MFILAFLEYLIFSSKIIFWFYTKNLTCRVLKILRQKCIVLKFLNPKFQLLNLRKWWFYVGLKPWHYLWDTLYIWFDGISKVCISSHKFIVFYSVTKRYFEWFIKAYHLYLNLMKLLILKNSFFPFLYCFFFCVSKSSKIDLICS